MRAGRRAPGWLRSWWPRAAVSLGVAAVLLSFVPLDRVLAALRDANPWIWAAALGVFAGGHTLNALKFRLLVGSETVSAADCIRAHFAGIASNLGLPGVVGGDIVRATYLAPSAGAAQAATAAVADRLVDGLVLLVLAGVSLRVAGPPPLVQDTGASPRAWRVILALAVVAVVVLLWRRARRSRVCAAIAGAFARLARRPRAVGLALTIGLGVQTSMVVMNARLGADVGVHIALAPWFVAWTVTKLSTLLPISLGGLGVREAALVAVLGAYGAPPDRVLAAGLLWEGAIVAGSAGGFVATQLLYRAHPPDG